MHTTIKADPTQPRQKNYFWNLMEAVSQALAAIFQTAITEGIQRKSAAFALQKQRGEEIANATTFAELDAIVW